MTYTEDRVQFEAQIFRPPHLARMLERAGEFTGRLAPADRDDLMEMAFEKFWALRDDIHTSADVERLWVVALQNAADTRRVWRVAVSHWGVVVKWEFVRSARLRRKA
jgi:uncharacterized protein with HEPN domain